MTKTPQPVTIIVLQLHIYNDYNSASNISPITKAHSFVSTYSSRIDFLSLYRCLIVIRPLFSKLLVQISDHACIVFCHSRTLYYHKRSMLSLFHAYQICIGQRKNMIIYTRWRLNQLSLPICRINSCDKCLAT